MPEEALSSWKQNAHSRTLSADWKLFSSAEAELRINPPTVTIDNESDPNATIVRCDSANRCVQCFSRWKGGVIWEHRRDV
eukprot:1181572-Prorocentrum_minimum.AAC.2